MSRIFYSHLKSISKKSIRPSAYESQKSRPTKTIRQKRAENNRSLALDSEKRAGSEKRAKTFVGVGSPLISVQEEDLVGSVHESDAAHWKRHGEDPSASTCGRCIYILNKAELYVQHPWLSPRPSFMGGRWRLGCDACSWRYKHS